MADTLGYIGQSVGEKAIQKNAQEIAAGLGLDVAVASWSVDFIAEPNEYIFTVVTETGNTGQLSFIASEIQGYASGTEVEEINRRIKKMLEGLK